MIFDVFPAGLMQANCYIAGDEKSREGIVVDPGGDVHKIIEKCEKNKLDIRYIILTHGHGDHIGAAYDLRHATDAKILMNKKDEFLVQHGNRELTAMFNDIKVFEIDQYINDKDVIKISGLDIEIIETPGHTPGGVCLKIEDIVISGDTLFLGSVGRTDFKMSSHEELIKSIKEKLLALPDSTIVYPGHGNQTTIGYERKYNPFL